MAVEKHRIPGAGKQWTAIGRFYLRLRDIFDLAATKHSPVRDVWRLPHILRHAAHRAIENLSPEIEVGGEACFPSHLRIPSAHLVHQKEWKRLIKAQGGPDDNDSHSKMLKSLYLPG